MGQVTRTYPQGHFRLYRRTKDNTKPLVVQMEYVINSIPIRRATGISVYEKDWNPGENKNRGGIKASYGPDYNNLNRRLVRMVEANDARIAEYVDKNHPTFLTPQIVRDILDHSSITREDKGHDFVMYIQEFLKSERTRNIIGESSYVNGMSALKLFTEFLKLKKLGTYKPNAIFLSEINVRLIEKYIEWRLTERENSVITVKHALSPILKGCTRAAKEGLISQHLIELIQDVKIVNTTDINEDCKSAKKHLTTVQLQQIIEFYKKDIGIARSECIEMFLFAIYAGGLRCIDIITLQWTNINFESKTLNKVQVKTKNRCVVPLSDNALTILKKWKERQRSKRFVFDLLPDDIDLNNGNILFKYRGTRTRSINYSLKVVGNAINLPFDLTFHVARHTFAIMSLNQGMSLTMVSQIMGHSTTTMTESVYAHYLTSTMDAELNNLKFPSLE